MSEALRLLSPAGRLLLAVRIHGAGKPIYWYARRSGNGVGTTYRAAKQLALMGLAVLAAGRIVALTDEGEKLADALMEALAPYLKRAQEMEQSQTVSDGERV